MSRHITPIFTAAAADPTIFAALNAAISAPLGFTWAAGANLQFGGQIRPQSTASVCPLMAGCTARKSMAFAMSSGCTTRFIIVASMY